MFGFKGFALGAAALGLIVSSSAMAAFTTVNPAAPGEPGHGEILSEVYGGTFVAAGNDFTNGTITATRVDDADDQVINGGGTRFDIRPLARFGDLYIDAGLNGNMLFNVTGAGYAVGGEAKSVTVPDGSEATITTELNRTFSSIEANNEDGRDHLVTYLLSGGDLNSPTIVWFWEDLREANPNADFDFNDLVVEGTASAVIPLPAAAYPGLALLLGLGGAKVLRRRAAH